MIYIVIYYYINSHQINNINFIDDANETQNINNVVDEVYEKYKRVQANKLLKKQLKDKKATER